MYIIVGAVLWIVFSTILILAICMLSARLTHIEEKQELIWRIMNLSTSKRHQQLENIDKSGGFDE